MESYLQIAFKENPKSYELLKENSYYFKYLNRGVIDFKRFNQEMKEKYKERATDKIESIIENMDLVSSILNVLK